LALVISKIDVVSMFGNIKGIFEDDFGLKLCADGNQRQQAKTCQPAAGRKSKQGMSTDTKRGSIHNRGNVVGR
jgi:hypothetical protein